MWLLKYFVPFARESDFDKAHPVLAATMVFAQLIVIPYGSMMMFIDL